MKIIRFITVSLIIITAYMNFGCNKSDLSKSSNKEKDLFIKKPANFKHIHILTSFSEPGKLAVLCKVWGFLKYHHPNIKTNKIDWDSILIEYIPRIEQTVNKEEFNSQITELINSAREFEKCKNCKSLPPEKYALIDDSWMTDSIYFFDNTTKLLQEIKISGTQTNNQYYAVQTSIGTVSFKHEKYYQSRLTDKDHRLLSLFKYWNIINYFFPYKNDIDENWNQVLLDLIPGFIKSESDIKYNLTVLKLVQKINDAHGFTYSQTLSILKGKKFTNCLPKLINDTLIVWRKYFETNDSLKTGDIILEVNNKKINKLIDSISQYVPYSNSGSLRRNTAGEILTSKKLTNKFKVLRGNDTLIYNTDYISRKKTKETSSNFINKDISEKPAANIIYIDITKLTDSNINLSFSKINFAEYLILDNRGYPNVSLFKIFKFLLESSEDFYTITYADVNFPGALRMTKGINTTVKNNKNYFKGELIILINEYTQSHSEFVTMALQQAEKVTLIGSHTAGADGNVTGVRLPGGIKTNFSGIGIYYPDMSPTQRIGIIPDIVVKPTIKGIQKGRDEVLERALEYIKTGK